MKLKKIIPLFIFAVALIALQSVNVSAKSNSEHGWLGVYIQDIDPSMAEAMNLKSTEGVLVNDVVDGSPADEAGIKSKDVIVKFNGEKCIDESELRNLIRDTKPNDKVKITVIRDGKKKNLSVKIGEASESSFSSNFNWNGNNPYFNKMMIHGFLKKPGIGIKIEDLNDQLGKYFGVKDGEGVLITEVLEDSPAEKAGLKAGDVIIKADGEDIEDSEDLRDIISEKEDGDKVKLTVLRNKDKKKFIAEVSNDYPFSEWGNFISPIRNMLTVQTPNFSDEDIDVDMSKMKESIKDLKEQLKELKKELKKNFKDIDIE